MNIQYKVQEKPNGFAEGLILAEDFIENDNICYMLGNNIFFGNDLVKIMENVKPSERCIEEIAYKNGWIDKS